MRYRFSALLVAIVGACLLGANGPPDKAASHAPLGTWDHIAEDGAKVILTIDETSVTLKARWSETGLTTMYAPSYKISDEGVLYGYFRDYRFTDDRYRQEERKDIFLFAFRAKVENEHLEISDVRMHGANPIFYRAIGGTYRIASEQNEAASATPLTPKSK